MVQIDIENDELIGLAAAARKCRCLHVAGQLMTTEKAVLQWVRENNGIAVR